MKLIIKIMFVFIYFCIAANVQAEVSPIFDVKQAWDCRTLARAGLFNPEMRGTSRRIQETCRSADCRALVNKNSRACETSDCRALVAFSKGEDTSSFTDISDLARALITDNDSLCGDNGMCRAMLAASEDMCAATARENLPAIAKMCVLL